MTKKNETLALLLTLGITAGIVGTGVWWFFRIPTPSIVDVSVTNSDLNQRLSYGEKSLIPTVMNPEKQLGISAFATGNYVEAIQHFQKSLQIHANDPEALIYLNNAKIGQKNCDFGSFFPDWHGCQCFPRIIARGCSGSSGS
jgi:branched-chain amino acid transport system substrate-binding protein